MIHSAHARGDPDSEGSRHGEVRVEDYQSWAFERVAELKFLVVAVTGYAGEVGVFASGERGGDADDGAFGRVGGGGGVADVGEGHEVGFGVDVVA